MTTLNRREVLLSGGAAALWMLCGRSLCADEPRVAAPSDGISEAQEIELGRRFAAQVERERQIVHHGMIDAYLGRMVRRLAEQSQRPNLPYSIKLVNSYQVNAFSLAGGFLYVNRGLVQEIRSEEELAAALSHEIGHVVARHSVTAITRTFAARQMLTIVLNNLFKNNGVVEEIIARFGGALAMLTLLHFDREAELEADLLGFYEMLRAGWDPHGFEELFAQLAQMEGRAGNVLSPYLSTHPPTPARLAAVRRELSVTRVPPGAITQTLSFRAFKAAMLALPRPPQEHSKG